MCDKRKSSIGNYANRNHYDSVDCTSYRRMSCFKAVKMARLQQLCYKICCMHLLKFMCSSLVTRVVIGSKKNVLCCKIVILTNTNSHKHNFTKTQFHSFILTLCLLQVHFCKSFRILWKILFWQFPPFQCRSGRLQRPKSKFNGFEIKSRSTRVVLL